MTAQQPKYQPHLPIAFVSHAARTLRIRPRAPSGFRALPFVAPHRAGDSAPAWNVPPSGGYKGGRATGEALAFYFLKHMRDNAADDVTEASTWLGMVAASLMARYAQEGGPVESRKPVTDRSATFSALDGQCSGFFGALSRWLAWSVQAHGDGLDALSAQTLLHHANEGLAFDAEAYDEFLETATYQDVA